MSDTTDESDDMPLAQRKLSNILSTLEDDGATFGGDGAKNDDEEVPEWMKTYKSPNQDAKAKPESSSDSEVIDLTEDATQGATQTSNAPSQFTQTQTVTEGGMSTQDTTGGKGKQAATGAAKPKLSEMPLLMPEKVARNKALVECEQGDGGTTDLTGDVGAVGRWGATEDGELTVDLKGVVYGATIVPSNTMMVINVGEKDAKVESVFSDFVQLREQVGGNAYATESTLQGNLADFFMGADSDDDMDGRKKEKKDKADAKRKREEAKGGGAAKKAKAGAAAGKGKGGGAAKKPAKKPAKKSVSKKK